jgi:putative tricarboxylic transport membrane protein
VTLLASLRASLATRADGVIGALLLAGGIAVAAWARGLPAGGPNDPLGPRGFPALLGAGLAGCGLVLLGQTLGRGRGAGRAPARDGRGEADGPVAVPRLLGGVLLTGLCVVTLEPLGYLVATPLFLATLLWLQGGVRARIVLATSLGVPLALYLLFARLMGVPLPLGLLEPLTRSGF